MDENEKYLKYKGLIFLAIERLHIFYRNNDDLQEWVDYGTDGIIKGIRTYKEDKGVKESTYVYACIVNELKHNMARRSRLKRQATVVSLNTLVGTEELGEFIDSGENIEEKVINKLMDEKILSYINQLKERKREIVKYKLGIDNHPTLSFTDIANMYGVNKNAIRDSYLRAIRIVYYKLRRDELEY